jgi:cysteine desulfurase
MAQAVPGVLVLGPSADQGRLPNLLCVIVGGVEAEPVLIGLDQSGVAAHSGSSCSSETLEPSPVLAAMGADAEHSLRLSVGWSTSDAEVEQACDALPRVVERLRLLGYATASDGGDGSQNVETSGPAGREDGCEHAK